MGPTPRENAALVREFLSDVVADGDTDAIGVFLADGAVDHHPVLEPRPESGPPGSVWWRVLAAADTDIAVDDLVAADDTVAARGTVTGSHCESLLDMTPSGASFEIDAVWFCRVEEGQIAEIWSLLDGLGLVYQLGALPNGGLNRLRPRSTEQ